MALPTSLSNLYATAGTNKAPTGTGYTNLNRFLTANAGNQLGQKVTGTIQNQVAGVQNQLGQQQNQFQTEAEKNRLDTEENKATRDQVIGRFADSSTAGGPLGAEDVAKFNSFRAGTYGGPTALQDTSVLSSQAQQLAQSTNNLTPSGTGELLRRTVGGTGRYTQGQQGLDSILFDRSGLRQVGREAQGLGSDINRANLAAQGQAQALAGQAAQFATDTTGQLRNALGGLDNAAQAQLATAQATEADRLARIRAVQDFAAGKVAQVDANGNVVKDQYGNTVYDTNAANPRGSTDAYTQIDNLRTLLLQKGANQAEVDTLLGGGDQTKQKAAYDAAQTKARTDYLNNVFYGANRNTSDGENIRLLLQSGYLQNSFAKPAQIEAAKAKMLSDVQNGIVPTGETFGQSSQSAYANQYNQALAQANTLYSPKGVAGIALNKGQLDPFFNNLAGTLANSQAAQGLTMGGVAAAPIRQNYAALASLLGTPDVNPYTGESTYSQGQFNLNPEALARTV